MNDQTPECPDLDPVLKQGANKRNRDAALKALARIHELGWEPLAPYPGSDTHWRVRCLLGCKQDSDWEGVMFYSHMRRARRHAGCLPTGLRETAIEYLNKARK